MPNQNQNTPKAYDAGDLHDAHNLAREQLNWVTALIQTVQSNIKDGKTYHNEELLEIAQYLSEMFANDHDLQQEAYKKEWEQAK